MVADPESVLDLSREGIAASFHAGSYDRVCLNSRRDFVDFIDGISASNADNIDWWVSSPASRNEVLSHLFHDFAVIRLVGVLLDKGALPGTLVVDSTALERSIRRLLARNKSAGSVRFQQKYSVSARGMRAIRRLLSPFRSACRLFYEWAVVNLAAKNVPKSAIVQDDVVLVDTFALSDKPGQDRYFPGLWENAGDEERKKVWFVPQFWGYRLSELPRFVRAYANSERNYLLKEQFLSIRDLAWSALHIRRRRSIDLEAARFEGLDYSDTVKHDLKRSSGIRCAMRGLLNYRFIMNLERRGVRLRKAIDWFENHPMDRGWNAAVNRVYGSDKAVGYQGFYPAFDAARITNREYQSKVTPRELVIMGSGFRPETMEFCPSLKTTVGPAFRYTKSDRKDVERRKGKVKDLLVALPYSEPLTIQMCRTVAELSSEYTDRRFIIKPHPANQQSVSDLLGTRDNLIVVDDALSTWFSRVSLVICGAESTVVLEAVVNGRPVILMGRAGYMYQISVPAAVPRGVWRACANTVDVRKAIGCFDDMSDKERMAIDPQKLKELFFTPVTRETVRVFLSPTAGEM